MKVLLKAGALAVALTLVGFSTSSASYSTSACTGLFCRQCWVCCPSFCGWMTTAYCCQEIPQAEYTCPDGSTAQGTGYPNRMGGITYC